ncbi:MAG: TerC family protein [Nitrococcus mobilis]|nr:TerC family protein [Nitrococcus mobilis]
MDWITDPQGWAALITLTVMEVVLGIDNIVFISILSDRLPLKQQPTARRVGLLLAMGTRLLLLLSLTWLMRLTRPLFTLFEVTFSGQDLILLAGGLFLIGKATLEVHSSLEGEEERGPPHTPRNVAGFTAVVAQIAVLDIVFSLDSVITAIGMADYVAVMVIAIVVAVLAMMVMVEAISAFIQRHPTIKMLALSFLILIGIALVGESLDLHIPKGYIYFAMAFSAGVEMLNLRLRRARPRRSRLDIHP